jgi:8-oxo-dGTP pyrophosphatase MutT (NUDIX family)
MAAKKKTESKDKYMNPKQSVFVILFDPITNRVLTTVEKGERGFPGGKREKTDFDIYVAASREFLEEVRSPMPGIPTRRSGRNSRGSHSGTSTETESESPEQSPSIVPVNQRVHGYGHRTSGSSDEAVWSRGNPVPVASSSSRDPSPFDKRDQPDLRAEGSPKERKSVVATSFFESCLEHQEGYRLTILILTSPGANGRTPDTKFGSVEVTGEKVEEINWVDLSDLASLRSQFRIHLSIALPMMIGAIEMIRYDLSKQSGKTSKPKKVCIGSHKPIIRSKSRETLTDDQPCPPSRKETYVRQKPFDRQSEDSWAERYELVNPESLSETQRLAEELNEGRMSRGKYSKSSVFSEPNDSNMSIFNLGSFKL